METLRRVVNEIAYAQDHSKLSTLHCFFIPFISLSSSLYRAALTLRHYLYHFGFFSKYRLQVPVISVGNLTWGGNGKTPMVEFIAHCLADSGIWPLVLTRGYGGGDEAKILQRHLLGDPAKVGVGANRAATAACFFEKNGYIDPLGKTCLACLDQEVGSPPSSEEINAVVLDDGVQHWSLWCDLEIVMINGLVPWGNHNLLPLGPLREPLMALRRADVAVVHHADLIGVFYVDRLDFSDRHLFQAKDIEMIRMRLRELWDKFGSKPIVVLTEKDYDRDPEILKHLDPFEVLALCSELQIVSQKGSAEDSFKFLLKELLGVKLLGPT